MVAQELSGMGYMAGPGLDRLSKGAFTDLRGRLALIHLPIMPQMLVQVISLCSDEAVSFSLISELVQYDAALVAKLFSAATAADTHGRRRPASVDQCLAMLGIDFVKTIAINESVSKVFRQLAKGRVYSLSRFWQDSLCTALIARELSRSVSFPNDEQAYLSGLLHDVGRLAMLAADQDSYSRFFVEDIRQDELCRQEYETFGVVHAEVGAWLVDRWKLNFPLVEALLFHHEPVERVASASPLVKITYLASLLSDREAAVGDDVWAQRAAKCGFPEIDSGTLRKKAQAEVTVLAAALGIDLSRVPLSPQSRDESARAVAA